MVFLAFFPQKKLRPKIAQKLNKILSNIFDWFAYLNHSTAQKMKFSVKISSVNVTKSAVQCSLYSVHFGEAKTKGILFDAKHKLIKVRSLDIS